MRRLALAGLMVCVAAPAALAQTSAPFIIDRNRIDRAPPAEATPPAPIPAAPAAAVETDVPAFVLSSVTLTGTSLPPDVLDSLIKPYIGKTMDRAALTDLANAVSGAYGARGDIALYTVTVPAQDFAGGALRLDVTEGYIAHVDLAGTTAGDVGLITRYAEHLTAERPLRRSTLQRYLSLMRDIPGLTVDAKLLRGREAGAVRLVLTLRQKDYGVKLQVNDMGNSILGRYQGAVDVSLYGALREGEETRLSFGSSTIFSRYQYYGLMDSEPLDDNGTTAQAAFGYLRTDIGRLGFSGNAKTYQLLISHPLIRSFDENLILGGDLDGIDTDNALLGLVLSNERTRTLRLTASYNRTDPKWALAASANLSQGLDGLGARIAQPGISDPGFDKLVLSAGYNRLLAEDWVVRVKAASQLAFSALPVSELYALGGGNFGRAFAMDSALGDTAAAVSLEIGWQPKPLPALLKGSELFAFGDEGSSWYRRRVIAPGTILPQNYHLASAGAGIRLPLGGKTRLEFAAANAVQDDRPASSAGHWRLLFGVTSAF
jgi:hemolysin activation/secretion protein